MLNLLEAIADLELIFYNLSKTCKCVYNNLSWVQKYYFFIPCSIIRHYVLFQDGRVSIVKTT